MTGEEVVDGKTDWAALDQTDDAETPPDDGQPPLTGEEPAAPPPSEKPQQPGQKPAQPGTEPQTPPTEQPGQPPKPGDQPEPQKPQQPPQETPEQIEARRVAAEEAEKKTFMDLVKFYEVPAEMAERLRTEPELVMPEMAAKVHQAVFRGMQQYMAQVVPQFLAQHAQVQEANTRTKEAFFGRWPSLAKHEAQVLQIAQMYLQMNPKSTPQDRLEQVGKLACTALGLTPDPAPDGQQPPAAPPRKGTPPAKPRQAFRPGNPSGSSSAAPPPSDNPYAVMAEEFLEGDAGQ